MIALNTGDWSDWNLFAFYFILFVIKHSTRKKLVFVKLSEVFPVIVIHFLFRLVWNFHYNDFIEISWILDQWRFLSTPLIEIPCRFRWRHFFLFTREFSRNLFRSYALPFVPSSRLLSAINTVTLIENIVGVIGRRRNPLEVSREIRKIAERQANYLFPLIWRASD